jgi:hypothetical protein
MRTSRLPETDPAGATLRAAHAMNNVLSVIVTHCRFLCDGVTDPVLKEDAEQIMGAALEGADIVKAIQDLATRQSTSPAAAAGEEPICH